MVSLLAVLPESLVRNLLSAWVDVKCMSRLDIAYCSHTERKSFLLALTNTEISPADSKFYGPHYYNKMLWMHARHVLSSAFHLGLSGFLWSANIALIELHIARRAARMKAVHIAMKGKEAETVLRMVASHNCSLTDLHVIIQEEGDNSAAWDVHLGAILTHSTTTLLKLEINCSALWTKHLAPDLLLNALWQLDVVIRSDNELLNICKAAPNAKNINLERPACTGAGLAAIAQFCHHLDTLVLSSNDDEARIPNIHEGLTAITEKCTTLRHLTLHFLPDLTDEGLTEVLSHCHQLQELVVRGCSVGDEALSALVQATRKNLQRLVLEECESVSDMSILEVADACPYLHTLELYEVPHVQGRILAMALPLLKNLTDLMLDGDAVTDNILMLIATHLPLLQRLSILHAHRVRFTSEGLMEVILHCSSLNNLFLELMNGVINDAVLAEIHKRNIKIYF